MSMSPGIRFLPTDEELIGGYLLKRVMGLPLPSHVILETDLYGQNTHPCDVFGDIDESNSWYWQLEDREMKDGATKKTIYVFTKLVKAGSNSSRIARRAGSGTWSGQTGARMIKNSNGQTIGSRKMFTFQDSTEEKSGFHWIMHEFSLDGVYKNLGRNNNNNEVVLCKITRSFKGKPTTNIENNGSPLDHIPQPVETTENNGDGYYFSGACNNGGGVDLIPQEVTIENNGDGYCFSSAYVNGGGVQIPESAAAIGNDGNGCTYPSAWINYGGGVDQIQQSEQSIENSGDGYYFDSACNYEGGMDQNHQIAQSTATIENNGDGYCFLSACNQGSSMDHIPQLPANIETNVEASASGQRRSWDEGTGVPLLEDCEGQIHPKKPRISSLSSNDDDNYANFLEEQLLADLDGNNTDDFFEGLPDFESLKWLADSETNVV